jgi:hypothetical protein
MKNEDNIASLDVGLNEKSIKSQVVIDTNNFDKINKDLNTALAMSVIMTSEDFEDYSTKIKDDYLTGLISTIQNSIGLLNEKTSSIRRY